MAAEEEWATFNKDVVAVRTLKKSPLVLRILLVFALLLAIYICFICFKQIKKYHPSKTELLRDHKPPCDISELSQYEKSYLHYPNPKTFDRKECRCNPVRFFVILSMQRSGSGWFETLMNSHSNISSNGEIFYVWTRRSNFSAIKLTVDQVYNLDWFTSAAKNECSAAVGFKWMLNQGVMEYHKEIVSYFNRRGVSAIFLFRKNLLRRMVSLLANTYDQQKKLLNGTHKSHVHSKFEAEILAKYKPTINVSFLVDNLMHVEQMKQDALMFFKNTRHIILYYEEVLQNRTKLVELQEFLRVPVQDLVSRQIRIHTRPLSQHIENWNEVVETLKDTGYSSFLDEDM